VLRIFRWGLTLYSIVFGGVALLAWGSYLVNLGSSREHLLPGIALYMVGLPSSMSMEALANQFPALIDSPVLVLTIMTLYGLFQVAVLWGLAIRFFPKIKKVSADEARKGL
jgi:hypothetical protein